MKKMKEDGGGKRLLKMNELKLYEDFYSKRRKKCKRKDWMIQDKEQARIKQRQKVG